MPLPVNTITRCEATLASGEQIVYSDWDAVHIKQARFAAIMAGSPISFTAVTLDGERFTVDLVTGMLSAGEEAVTPIFQGDRPALRLIYYKRMSAGAGEEPVCDFFVVGWQATIDGKNVKTGLKVYPATQTWEVTEGI
jgi:hypothetical protein